MLLLKPKCLPYLRIKKYETNVHPIITHNAVLAAIFGWLYWTNTFDVPAILLYYCSRKESKMIASLNLGICKSLKTFWGRWTNIRNQILLLWLNMPTRYKQGHWSSKSHVHKEDNNNIIYYVWFRVLILLSSKCHPDTNDLYLVIRNDYIMVISISCHVND